jgi:ribosome-associated toxin RatA of RatAB toxin-antitoxin module
MGVTRTEGEIVIDAPVEVVFGAITDYGAIPEWQSTVVSTEVLERDAEGRGTKVAFVIDIKVKKLRYTNAYTYDAPTAIDVEMIEGDIKSSAAKYRFTDAGDGRTNVWHEVAVDPGMFVPGPIKKMLTGEMLKGTLKDLKARAESLA